MGSQVSLKVEHLWIGVNQTDPPWTQRHWLVIKVYGVAQTSVFGFMPCVHQ